MIFNRIFTAANIPVEKQIKWKKVNCKIGDSTTGETIFERDDIEVPEQWSQDAANIMARMYLRKAGVPQMLNYIPWAASEKADRKTNFFNPSQAAHGSTFGPETSAKQIFHRLTGCWTYWGMDEGLITSEDQAQIFYDETYYMLAMQMAAPNSPQWFNCGLHWAYGIEGPDSGQWAVNSDTDSVLKANPNEDAANFIRQTHSSYKRPQVHACYILPVQDDLVNEGGIMDLWLKEVRLFKHGSGTGSNFSNIRSKYELLSGGGRSSGLISFLKIGDVAAGSIKSGGATRRAAKMVCLDIDHPEIEDFIQWKMREEEKAACISLGSKLIAQSLKAGNYADLPLTIADRHKTIPGYEFKQYGLGWRDEAIGTVSGQNANDSVRIPDEFMEVLIAQDSRGYDFDSSWELKARTTGEIIKTTTVKKLWRQICEATWACGDPGIQFDDIINDWHTCKADGRIRSSNPCGEYNFIDNTACNLASLNLIKFLNPDSSFNILHFQHACNIWTVILEISVHMASFPSKEIALGSYNYRTLGLGYANLGALLMRCGLPYDSDEGRSLAAAITALMTGQAYLTSGYMADEIGPFARWEQNKESMMEVLHKHDAAIQRIRSYGVAYYIITAAENVWNSVLLRKSFRNAQTTVIAPTGTISFVMDCDTTGIEPDFALVKYKTLAEGGDVKIVNDSVYPALLNFMPSGNAQKVIDWIKEHDTIEGCPELERFQPQNILPVFDCAVPPLKGERSLRPMAHILMVAAAQPFLSGAASKTVNLPRTCSIEDVSDLYIEAWKLGVKCVAPFRYGSKMDQPLSSGSEKIEVKIEAEENHAVPESTQEGWRRNGVISADAWNRLLNKGNEAVITDIIGQALVARERLPSRRPGYTQKVKIDGQTFYYHTGEYKDGRLGEIFMELADEGSTLRAMFNAYSKLISIALQYGVPLQELVDSFVHIKFEPAGIVEGSDNIRLASSPIDFLFRDLAVTYLGQKSMAHDTPEEALVAEASEAGSDQDGRIFELCPECHNASLTYTGNCVTCRKCSYNGGCS